MRRLLTVVVAIMLTSISIGPVKAKQDDPCPGKTRPGPAFTEKQQQRDDHGNDNGFVCHANGNGGPDDKFQNGQ